MVETHGRASLHEIYGYKVDYGEARCLLQTHGRASVHEIYGNTVDCGEAGCLIETHGRASLHEIYGFTVDYGEAGNSLIYCAPPELDFSHRRDTLQIGRRSAAMEVA